MAISQDGVIIGTRDGAIIIEKMSLDDEEKKGYEIFSEEEIGTILG